jgi:3-hydroxyisobutyrate dehydrogenase-like beta-hydroxyacid dehydrogenase
MEAGFIGLGAMGHAMAANLLRAGHALAVWNRSPQKAQDLAAAGATAAGSPAEAARAGVVLTMLADDAAVEAVVERPDGVLAGLPPGGLHVSMSTISYALSERLTRLHAEHGQQFVAAPVFGRPQAAEAAKLFVAAAGPEDQIARAEPLFAALGQRIFRLGERPAAANLVKLCGNFMIMCAVEAMAEAMTLAGKAGVEKGALLEVLTGTLFGAPVYQTYGEILRDERFRPAGFRSPLGLKDMRLAGQAAEELRAPMPFLGVVRDHLLQAIAVEGEDVDWSAVALAVQRNAGA